MTTTHLHIILNHSNFQCFIATTSFSFQHVLCVDHEFLSWLFYQQLIYYLFCIKLTVYFLKEKKKEKDTSLLLQSMCCARYAIASHCRMTPFKQSLGKVTILKVFLWRDWAWGRNPPGMGTPMPECERSVMIPIYLEQMITKINHQSLPLVKAVSMRVRSNISIWLRERCTSIKWCIRLDNTNCWKQVNWHNYVHL